MIFCLVFKLSLVLLRWMRFLVVICFHLGDRVSSLYTRRVVCMIYCISSLHFVNCLPHCPRYSSTYLGAAVCQRTLFYCTCQMFLISHLYCGVFTACAMVGGIGLQVSSLLLFKLHTATSGIKVLYVNCGFLDVSL